MKKRSIIMSIPFLLLFIVIKPEFSLAEDPIESLVEEEQFATENKDAELKLGNEDKVKSNMIEIYQTPTDMEIYKNRRPNWSFRFNINYEPVAPTSYLSPGDGSSYLGVYGSKTVDILAGGVGLQGNTSIGAFFIDFGYGTGSIKSNGSSKMSLSKTYSSVGYLLDTLSDNPWVSPFVTLQIFKLSWEESYISNSVLRSFSGTIQMATEWQAGLSIHLNKLDKSAGIRSYLDYGMKNSFLDVFAFQMARSGNNSDPNFSTEVLAGANIRLEF